MSITETKSKKKRSKKKSTLKTISFDEEVVTKNKAKEILENPDLINKNLMKREQLQEIDYDKREVEVSSESNAPDSVPKPKKDRKKKKVGSDSVENSKQSKNAPQPANVSPTTKKRKSATVEEETNIETEENEASNEPKPLSIRATKRMKHAKLIEDKKMKSDLAIQEKTFNYLSKWKHNRNEWKFEKLKQIWLQQNLFNSAKIPDEFWKTVVDYMGSASAHVRDLLCKEALKIIEKEDEETNENDEHKIRVSRARDIIQCLQE